MPNWEYKVISSGRGGFATPALLEKFLNDLGQEEWEIIEFRSSTDNALAFSGLARRPTEREWTLEDAAATAARAEADKLRAEFEAKFKGMASTGGAAAAAADEPPAPVEKGDDGLRRLRDTDSDQDPDAPTEPEDDWDKLSSEDELPSFFDAIRPLMRRNQRGPGLSVGVDQLARKWDFSEEDVKAALVECGFALPEDEDAKPTYLEYEGDLYWVNVNRRGELWVNTREKPRPVFRTVKGNAVAAPETERQESGGGQSGDSSVPQARDRPTPEPSAPSEPLPTGPALLEKIRPQMRRNRRGPGASGSVVFLMRAFRCTEADLLAGFATNGLTLPVAPATDAVFVELGEEVWWLNQDQRGGIWINQRLKSEMGDDAASPSDGSAGQGAQNGDAAPASDAPANTTLSACRLLLKPTRTGGFAATVDALAVDLSRPVAELTAALVEAGLRVPEKPRDKPLFAESGGEVFWLNVNAKGELWLNAKASKYSKGEGRRTRGGTASSPSASVPS